MGESRVKQFCKVEKVKRKITNKYPGKEEKNCKIHGNIACLSKWVHGCIWISWCVRIAALIPKRTKTDRKGQQKNVTCKVLHVTWHVSCVRCHLSCVTCHMSLTATTTATDPPPANSPLCTVGWSQRPTNQKKSKRQKSLKWQKLKKF